MDDVLAHVVLGRGDEPLDALDVPAAVVLLNRLCAAGADIRARVGLGQHHRRAPQPVDHELADRLLLRGAELVDDVGEGRPAVEHPHRRVGAEHHLSDGPHQRPRGQRAAVGRGALQAPPLGVLPDLVRLLEGGRHHHGVRGRVEDGRVAVGVDVGVGEGSLGQGADLGEDVTSGLGIDVGEGPLAQPVSGAQDFEQVELDVSKVALVMAHRRASPCYWSVGEGYYWRVALASGSSKPVYTRIAGTPAAGRLPREGRLAGLPR